MICVVRNDFHVFLSRDFHVKLVFFTCFTYSLSFWLSKKVSIHIHHVITGEGGDFFTFLKAVPISASILWERTCLKIRRRFLHHRLGAIRRTLLNPLQAHWFPVVPWALSEKYQIFAWKAEQRASAQVNLDKHAYRWKIAKAQYAKILVTYSQVCLLWVFHRWNSIWHRMWLCGTARECRVAKFMLRAIVTKRNSRYVREFFIRTKSQMDVHYISEALTSAFNSSQSRVWLQSDD